MFSRWLLMYDVMITLSSLFTAKLQVALRFLASSSSLRPRRGGSGIKTSDVNVEHPDAYFLGRTLSSSSLRSRNFQSIQVLRLTCHSGRATTHSNADLKFDRSISLDVCLRSAMEAQGRRNDRYLFVSWTQQRRSPLQEERGPRLLADGYR